MAEIYTDLHGPTDRGSVCLSAMLKFMYHSHFDASICCRFFDFPFFRSTVSHYFA